jgi:hypothetical protein
VTEYVSLNAQVVTSKPPEHPLLARPARDMAMEKPLNYADIHQCPDQKDKKKTGESDSVTMTTNLLDEGQQIDNSEFMKLEHRNSLPLGSVNVGVIVPCDRTSQHLPRIAEEKDSPTGSKEEAMPIKPLIKEAPSSNDMCIVRDQGSCSLNFGLVKNIEMGLKKNRTESKCDLNTQKGKTSDFKSSKVSEEKVIASNKSDTRTHRKECTDSSYNIAEGKNSKSANPEKDVKTKAADESSSSHSETGKSSAQDKRELYQVGSSKE